MKRYKTTERLTEGDIVEYGVDDIPYMAVRLDETKPCMAQCSMAYCKEHAFCSGFCYRWENGEDFVFVNADLEPQKSVTFVESPISRQYREENKIY